MRHLATLALCALLALKHATAVARPVTGGAGVLPACSASSPGLALLRESDNAFACLSENPEPESCPGSCRDVLGARQQIVCNIGGCCSRYVFVKDGGKSAFVGEAIGWSAAGRGNGKTCAGFQRDASCAGKCVATALGQDLRVGCGKVELPAYEDAFSGQLDCDGTALLLGELEEMKEEETKEVSAVDY